VGTGHLCHDPAGDFQINLEVVTAFCLMALGMGIVFLLDWMGRALSRQ
jgi:hypothetical protein